MFNTPYNRKIADEMHSLNKKFVKHAEDSGRMVKDKKMESSIVHQPEMTAQAGAGIFSGLLSKIGLGETGGACGCAGVGRRRGRPSKQLGKGEDTILDGGKKKVHRRRVGKGDLEGSGIFSGLLSKIGLGETGGAVSAGRRRGRPSKKVSKKDLKGSGIFSGLLSKVGLGETGGAVSAGAVSAGRRRGRPSKKGGAMSGGAYGYNMVRKMGEGKKGKKSKKSGAGLMDIVDTVGNLFGGLPSTPLEQIAGPKLTQQFKNIGREMVGEEIGLGKKKKGGILGIKAPSTFYSDKAPKPFGLGKKKIGGEWVNFVKSWAKTHNMKYNEALKDKRVSMAYKNRK